MMATAAVLAGLFAIGGPMTGLQDQPLLITVASNVRLRTEASVEVPILSMLPIATDLTRTGGSADGRWLHVRTPDGTEGWVSTALTWTVPTGHRQRLVERLIQVRLNRQGDGFETRAELLELIERTAAGHHDREGVARFVLYRLQALDGVLRSIPFSHRSRSARVSQLLQARAAVIVYNEPGGRWMLRRDAILEAHEPHRGTREGQQIAWMAATNGLPGECEGDLACYVRWTDLLEGEYLRLYPQGSFVLSGLGRIHERIPIWLSLIQTPDSRFFDPATTCLHLRQPLGTLRSAIEGATGREPGASPDLESTQRERILLALDEIGARCGGPAGSEDPALHTPSPPPHPKP